MAQFDMTPVKRRIQTESVSLYCYYCGESILEGEEYVTYENDEGTLLDYSCLRSEPDLLEKMADTRSAELYIPPTDRIPKQKRKSHLGMQVFRI